MYRGAGLAPRRSALGSRQWTADDLVLEMRGITKAFPGIVANDRVDFDLRRGEVHALLGENGAGKSTLMNILYGLYKPDEGEIRLKGKPVTFTSAKDAIQRGIGMVHQHFMLIPVMTVAENIVLGNEPTREGRLPRRARPPRSACASSRSTFGLAIDPEAQVAEHHRRPAAARRDPEGALPRRRTILILDEPTAVLTPQEAGELFEILAQPGHGEGKSIIFISHKLNEVLEIADRITVLRRGKKIETVPREGATRGVARAGDGRARGAAAGREAAGDSPATRCSRSSDLHVLDDRGIEKVKGVSLRRCARARSSASPASTATARPS